MSELYILLSNIFITLFYFYINIEYLISPFILKHASITFQLTHLLFSYRLVSARRPSVRRPSARQQARVSIVYHFLNSSFLVFLLVNERSFSSVLVSYISCFLIGCLLTCFKYYFFVLKSYIFLLAFILNFIF